MALLLTLSMGTASAELVVVVSANSPIGELTDHQVASIFLGRNDRLANGARAVPVDQPEGSIAREKFYLKLVGKSPAQIKAHWSKLIFTGRGHPPKEIDGDRDIKLAVSRNLGFIGYIERGSVDASVKTVLMLP